MDSDGLPGRKPPPPVPKFASFRPKTTSAVQSEANRVVDELVSVGDRGSSSNGKSSSFKKGRSPYVEVNTHRSRPRTRVSKTTKRSSDTSVPAQPLQEEISGFKDSSNIYFFDEVGDPQNLKYGSPNRGAFPPYFRAGAGGIIGLARHRKIDRLASDHRAVVLSKNPHASSTNHGKLAFDKVNRKQVRKLQKRLNGNGNEGIDPTADYVAVTGPKKRKMKYSATSDSSSSSTRDGNNHYRLKERTTEPVNRAFDEDLSYCTGTSASDSEGGPSSTFADKVQQRRVELSTKIDSDPTCCDAWLALIDYQDTILVLDRTSNRPKITKAETQSIAEVKISIYEKAIAMVESLADKEHLILGMMDEGKKLWESKKLSSKWRALIQRYPSSVILWVKYLDFKQSDFSSFRYEEVRTVYLDCLKTLREVRMRPGMSIADCDTIYTIQLYVILRMTVLMREAGFSEHAVASWQATLEYIFFKPVEFQQQMYQSGGALESHTMSAFEEFWESELPRIGEDRAEGWSAYKPQNGRPSEPKEDAENMFTDCGRVFEAWVQSERQKSLQSRIPARTSDKIEENDPYRVVLFSDLRDMLVDPPSHSGQELVMIALLAFCHLPPYLTEFGDDRSRTWWHDSFFRNENLYYPHIFLSQWKSELRTTETETSALNDHQCNQIRHPFAGNPFRFCTPDYQLSPSSLFAANETWFAAFDSWKDECFEDRGPVEVQWVRQTLKALVHLGVGGESLAEYYLALELRFSPSTVRKLAKSLIKNRPSSMRLYNSYALIEYHLGNDKSAENVIVTTINMSKTLDEQVQRESILLWSSWMWALLNAGRTALALERLLMFTNHTLNTNKSKDENSLSQNLITPESSILLLRTQNALIAARDQAISLAFPSHAAIAVECLILLRYLADRRSLPAARSVFTSNVDMFSSRFSHLSISQEHIHQSFARLLCYHATHAAYFSPSIIRSSLAESIALFPHNTIFLSLYTWVEARFRIDDRVRSIMRDVVLISDRGKEGKYQESVMSHFFAVHTEINRSITLGSNVHTVRGTFERGVGSSCGAHSAGFWKLYFLFELSSNELEKAKSVFYRGMKACPWAKELYMMAFEYLRTVMGETELRGLYELMVEKELRIHLELEEIFDKRDKK